MRDEAANVAIIQLRILHEARALALGRDSAVFLCGHLSLEEQVNLVRHEMGLIFTAKKYIKTNKSIICYKSDQIHDTVALQPQPFQSHVTPL